MISSVKRVGQVSLVVLCSAIVTSLLLACGHKNAADGNTFFDVVDSTYVTNNLERAQSETPFQIVLPRFVPGNTWPTFQGELRESQTGDETIVRVSYSYPNKAGITFEETNNVLTLPPKLIGPETREVAVGKTSVTVIRRAEFGPLVYECRWSKDDLYYYVASSGFSEGTLLKMITSMIR